MVTRQHRPDTHRRARAATARRKRSTISRVGQVAQHPAQGHFRISGLEAALHRGSDPALRLGVEHALAEEIGVAPEVLGRRERDLIDPILDRAVAGGREPGDPMSERC